ncbi:MAG: DUF3667 domain-containing protein [Flavobacteriaceae bacterium]|nr:DUF3667 domain-containing protein [Flavobacteriaceae bacterium]
MESNTTICKNCEIDHEVGFEFCPHCGQKTNDELTVGELFYNTISNYFSFDARFFKSFIPLMFKPGILAKRFIEGKRLLYLHPAQMYLFISVVFFFLFSIISRDFVNKSDTAFEKGFKSEIFTDTTQTKALDSASVAKLTAPLRNSNIVIGIDAKELEALDSIITASKTTKGASNSNLGFNKKQLDSLIAINAPEEEQLKAMGMKDDTGFFQHRLLTQGLKFYKQSGKGIVQAFLDSIPISIFILLPIFALILKLFFWRRGSFAHHLVFSFYYYSFLFTALSIILLTNFIWEVPNWVGWLIMLSTFFYLFFAIKNFYGQGYFLSFFKTSVVVFVYTIFVIPIAIGIMMVGAFLFY